MKKSERISGFEDKIHVRKTFYIVVVKRFFDIFFSLLALIIISLLLLIMSIITLFDVGRPVFFRQKRVGKGGRIFRIYKFHNMKDTKDENGNLLPPEQRVTKFGRFTRKTSLDEIPNFINVLIGDMSLVGPRPLEVEDLPLYTLEHLQRYSVRPGLECPQFTKLDHPRTWKEQLDNDVWYANHCNFLTDIKGIFGIIGMVFHSRGSQAGREDGSRELMYDENDPQNKDRQ